MAKKNVWKILALLFGAGFLGFLMLIAFGFYFMNSGSVQLKFYNNDIGELLYGSVNLNGQYYGETQNGIYNMPKANFTTGKITLDGMYDGQPFTLDWNITEQDLTKSHVNLWVDSQTLSDATFNAAKSLNTISIETTVLTQINEIRAEHSLKPFIPSNSLSTIADERSQDMADREYFDHITPEGKDIFQILKENNIGFFSAGENIYAYYGINQNTDLATECVQKWMESPAHRSLILDQTSFDHAGIGITCKENNCYVTLIAATLQREFEDTITLSDYYVTYTFLNDQGLDQATINTDITISSDKGVTVFIMNSKQDYDNLLDDIHYNSYIKRFDNIETLNISYSAKPGNVLVIMNDHDRTAHVNLKVIYKAV